MNTEKEEYIISVDKKTYELIKYYYKEYGDRIPPFSDDRLSYIVARMIHNYMKAKYSGLIWTCGVLFVFALEMILMPIGTWYSASLPDVILTSLILILPTLALGFIVSMIFAVVDGALIEHAETSRLPKTVKKFILPILTLVVLNILAVFYAIF